MFSSGTNYFITNGLFTAQIDFGRDVFTGQPLWLQFEAKADEDTVWEQLSPRQLLTPTPYAIHALTVVDADGVALAAIQGLNQKVEAKEAEIVELKRTVGELKQMLSALTARLDTDAE